MNGNLLEWDTSLPPVLSDLFDGFRAARVIQVANELNLFVHLASNAKTAAEVAALCGTHPDMTERFLICCCALGLLHKIGERYTNTRLAKTYLLPGKPLYQGNILGHVASLWDFWSRLEAVLYGGRRDASPDVIPPKPPHRNHENFIRGMHNVAVTGTAQMVAHNSDLRGCRRLLDVGGGPGTYSIALCQRYPDLSAVIFDLPETLAIARETIACFGLQDRVLTEEGDWNQPSYGSGYDAVLFSNVLHGPASGAFDKLRKGREALNPGGRLLVHDFLLNNEKTGPLPAALFNMTVGAYSLREMIEVITAAGFVEPRLVAVHPRGTGLLLAEKPS